MNEIKNYYTEAELKELRAITAGSKQVKLAIEIEAAGHIAPEGVPIGQSNGEFITIRSGSRYVKRIKV